MTHAVITKVFKFCCINVNNPRDMFKDIVQKGQNTLWGGLLTTMVASTLPWDIRRHLTRAPTVVKKLCPSLLRCPGLSRASGKYNPGTRVIFQYTLSYQYVVPRNAQLSLSRGRCHLRGTPWWSKALTHVGTIQSSEWHTRNRIVIKPVVIVTFHNINESIRTMNAFPICIYGMTILRQFQSIHYFQRNQIVCNCDSAKL